MSSGRGGTEAEVRDPADAGSGLSRRDALKLLGVMPLVGAVELGDGEVARAARMIRGLETRSAATPYALRFFTEHEWETVGVLADLVIPRDERSGSATDAKVPEFMDFMLGEGSAEGRLAMRGGLAWLDAECRRRFRSDFLRSTPAQRTAVLDDIAWPARARPEMSHGVAFFNRFRDLTASGFWSSMIGYQDLQYQGNAALPEWKGCPDAAMRKLGVTYGD